MNQVAQKPPSLSDALLRRPFAPVLALFILGIFSHTQLPHRPAVYLAVAGADLFLALILHHRRLLPHACLAAAIFLAGLAAAQLEAFYYPANHIAHFTTDEPRLAQLELRIDQPPRILNNAATFNRPLPPRQVTQATVLRILTNSGWQDASGRILLQIDDPHSDLAINQTLRVLGLLHRIAPAMNPGEFDWSTYYRQQRILASLQVAHSQNIQILASPGQSPLDWLRALARRKLQQGFTEQQALDHALLRALVLGDSDPQLRDVQEQFIRTGTSHHLAISGMHIGILGLLVYFICRVLLLNPRNSVWIALTITLLYGLLVLPSPPVVRSVLLAAAFSIGMLGRRCLDGIQLLCLSAFAMLIYHPLDLYDAGFQLSFGTVLGLMIFVKPSLSFVESFRDPDTVIADSIRRPTLPQLVLRGLRRAVMEILITGLVAWLVSAPLIAWHFNQMNPWGIPASLVLAIPVFFGLIGGILKIVLTILLPPFAGVLATLAAIPMATMRHIVDWFAQLPGNDAPLPTPPLWAIAIFYMLIALPLLSNLRPRLRPALRCGPALACLLVLILPLLLAFSPSSAASGELRLTLLSVGAGQCAAVHLPSGRIIFVDAGSSSITDLSRRVITPYLKSLGRQRVDALFVSHANYDHFSAAGELASSHDVLRIYTNPLFSSHANANYPAKVLLQTLASLGRTPELLSAGRHLELEKGVDLDILWPPAGRALEANDSCLVLRLTYAGRSILFPADIQDIAEGELLADPAKLRCDVLVAPHHGSASAATADFLAAAQPRCILASNGHTLSQKQRDFDALAAGIPLYRTHKSGAISLIVGRDGRMRLETFLRRPTQSNEIQR